MWWVVSEVRPFLLLVACRRNEPKKKRRRDMREGTRRGVSKRSDGGRRSSFLSHCFVPLCTLAVNTGIDGAMDSFSDMREFQRC
jgi:hypothetical protein